MIVKARKAPPYLVYVCFFSVVLVCFEPGKAHGGIRNNNNIKGMFVFGSSLVDNGNNNYIKDTLAGKANYSPYGIDFPLGPTGRFTNGKNVIDLLGNLLQLPDYLPVVNDPSTKGSRIIHGVNYASGGSGILDDTGPIAGNVTSLNKQINNFEEVTLGDLERQMGNMSKKVLGDSIFVVGSGGNDYTLNYFLTKLYTNITLPHFTSNLTATLTTQLKRLHSRGARKFVVMGLYPLWCTPNVRVRQPLPTCNPILNRAARLFNVDLRSLVDLIKPQMSGSSLIFVNSYKIIRDIIRNPSSKGFSNTRNPCCEVGNGMSCKRGGSACENREDHVYFDGLHPTEAVNRELATKAFSSNLTSEVYPFNIQHLSNIELINSS